MRHSTQEIKKQKAALIKTAKTLKAKKKQKTIDLRLGAKKNAAKKSATAKSKTAPAKSKQTRQAKGKLASKDLKGKILKTAVKKVSSAAQRAVGKGQKLARKIEKVTRATPPLSRRVALVKAEKIRQATLAKQRKEMQQRMAEEKTDVALPVYLTTPTKKMLKVFRHAKRKQDKVLAAKKGSARGFLAKVDKSAKRYVVDLRIHTPATDSYLATGGIEPNQALVRLAKAKGVDLLAVTDLYSAASVDEVKQAGQDMKITILPGVEIVCEMASCSDIPFVCLFPEYYGREEIERVLRLLDVPGEAEGHSNYLLRRDLRDVLRIVEGQGGLMIPSHVDKTPIRQLAIPSLVEDYGFHLFDLVYEDNVSYFKENWPNGGFTFSSFSNANSLAQVGTRLAKLRLKDATFAALKDITKRRDGE
ncbi:MAG: hypothetical protein IT292_05150 [Deltaproteobacteria bacterium]|nr:hypothetical protein [Deltaproteobacteria bacterium]